jgi:hypothetical protein
MFAGTSSFRMADSVTASSDSSLIQGSLGEPPMTTRPPPNHQFPHAASASQSNTLTSIAASATATLARSMNANASKTMLENARLSSRFPVSTNSMIQKAPSWLQFNSSVSEGRSILPDEKLLEQQLAAAYPRPIAMNPHIHTSGIPSEPMKETSNEKSKVRPQLTDVRKQEIQKMRKIGSCIRCKMLRKTCSENTPCITCSAIDSPRNWKGFACLRARLAELYQGYALGLYQTLSFQNINTVKSRMAFTPSPNKVVVKYFADADPFVLSALECQTTSIAGNPWPSMQETAILDTEANDLPTIFEGYIHKGAARFFEQETSQVLKSAAMLVHEFSQESGDILLKSVLGLWMVTTMLSDPSRGWQISAFQNLPQGSDRHNHQAAAPIEEQAFVTSHALICSQLHGGLERLATKLSANVMHKFEQCLKRPSTSLNQFETFLISLILVNCVERHSLIFHSWICSPKARQWPFDQSPAVMIAQAEQVAKVIAFMIKVRNLAPKITDTMAGGILKAEAANNEKYGKWFEEIGVTFDFLAQRQDAVFDAGDCRSLDLKYSATLLLPPQRA